MSGPTESEQNLVWRHISLALLLILAYAQNTKTRRERSVQSGRTSGAGFCSTRRQGTTRKQWSYPCRAERGVGHAAGRGRGQRVRVRHHGQGVLLESCRAARPLSRFQSLNFSSQHQPVKVLQVLRGDQASHLRKQGELERDE